MPETHRRYLRAVAARLSQGQALSNPAAQATAYFTVLSASFSVLLGRITASSLATSGM
jgi:hypothetical protein